MNNSVKERPNKTLAEIEAERMENLERLKELLQFCERAIDTTDSKIEDHKKTRAEQVLELNRIRDLIAKHE